MSADGWKPISSAPKDGTSILIATRSHSDGLVIAKWHQRGRYQEFIDDSGESYHDASHWMPLPPPPVSSHD
jgi:hypothetical protein